jgi:glutamine amidotransferase
VPTNSTLTIHKQTVMIHPIIDEYYDRSPSHGRSSQFARDRGLISGTPGAAQSITPESGGGATPSIGGGRDDAGMEAVRRKLEEVA